jgi:hypothetical protein
MGKNKKEESESDDDVEEVSEEEVEEDEDEEVEEEEVEEEEEEDDEDEDEEPAESKKKKSMDKGKGKNQDYSYSSKELSLKELLNITQKSQASQAAAPHQSQSEAQPNVSEALAPTQNAEAQPQYNAEASEHKKVGLDFFKKHIMDAKGEIGILAKQKKLLEGIREGIESGYIRFRDIPVTFLGSHQEFDKSNSSTSPSSTMRTISDIYANVFSEPVVGDLDVESIVLQAYNGIAEGVVTKIVLMGYTNTSDKEVALVCSNPTFNTKSFTSNPAASKALCTAFPNHTVHFPKGIVLYNIHTKLKDAKHQKQMLSGRASIKSIQETQIMQKDERGRARYYIKVPPAIAAGMKKKELKRRIIEKTRDMLKGEDADAYVNNWIFAYIMHHGHKLSLFTTDPKEKSKINTSEDQEIMREDDTSGSHYWMKLPVDALKRAMLEFETQISIRELLPTNVNDMSFQIFPVSHTEFSESRGVSYGVGGLINESTKSSLSSRFQSESSSGRTVSFTLNITVLPVGRNEQTRRAGVFESGEAQKPVDTNTTPSKENKSNGSAMESSAAKPLSTGSKYF